MKNQLLLVGMLFSTFTIFSQVLYKNAANQEFKNMLANGLTYIPTGNAHTDSCYINAFEENWNISKFEVYNTLDAETKKIPANQIVAIEAKINETETILALINFGAIMKNEISKYATIGYICVNGFNQLADKESKSMFINQAVIGINDALKTVKDNSIRKMGVGLYKEIYESILPKAIVLKSKTLLIVGNTKKYVDLKALKKNGISYKLVSFEEYTSMEKEDLSTYCLMYFAYNSYTEISIFDLGSKELIYTRHFASAKAKFEAKDMKKIRKLWANK